MSNRDAGRFEGGYYSLAVAASVAGVGIEKLLELAEAGLISTMHSDGVTLFSKDDIRKVRDARRGRGAQKREAAAEVKGHCVSREHADREPGETATSRMHCTCGWSSPWLVNAAATQEKRKHLKDAIANG